MPLDEKKKEMLMELLAQLVDEMDDFAIEENKMPDVPEEVTSPEGEPMAVIEEKTAMPLDEAKEEVVDKIDEAALGAEEELEEEEDETGKPNWSNFVRRG